MAKQATRKPPAPTKVTTAKADKGAHAAAVWQQLGNQSGVILRPGKK